MFKNKKLIGVAAVVLAIMTVASASFAWFTSNDSITNHLESGQFSNGDVKLVEIFDPDTPLDPGVDVNKDVWAVNIGSVDALVRLSFAEVLQKLVADGNNPEQPEITNFGEVYGSTSKSTAGVFPILFNADALATGGAYAAPDWQNLATNPPANLTVPAGTIPDGVTILYKALTANGKTTYVFVAYAALSGDYNGKYQAITANYKVSEAAPRTLTISGVNYQVVTQSPTIEKAKWAALAGHDGDAYKTTNMNPAFDGLFGDFFTGIPAVPQLTAQFTDDGTYYTFAKTEVDNANHYIELVFAPSKVTLVPTANKWWYNPADGYFYFVGKVAPGQSTPELLDAVRLNNGSDSIYNKLSYDLIVKMDAIQNLQEALNGTAGWNVNVDDLTNELIAANAFAAG
ncbi:MAG: hypothetical protein LBO63_06960 [Oscillospiraceae bacterium]|jgi:hypothetical protein|nr:hypothetical protein [Oscillospiraceae bacterium]